MRSTLVVFTERGKELLLDIVMTINGIELLYAEAIGTAVFDDLRSLLGTLRAAVCARRD